MTGLGYEILVVGRLDDSILARIKAELGDVVITIEPVAAPVGRRNADPPELAAPLDPPHGPSVPRLRRLNLREASPMLRVIRVSPEPAPGR